MEEITVCAGERVRLMLRLAASNLPDAEPDSPAPTGLHGEMLFKNATGDGTFTVSGGPASVVEDGEKHVALMLNGTAEGGLGRYVVDRIQLSLPHRAPIQVPKDDPLFQSFFINVTGPAYPKVEDIKPRPDDVVWVEESEKANSS